MKSFGILVLFIGIAAAQRQLSNSLRGNNRCYNGLSQSSVSKSSSSESAESADYKKSINRRRGDFSYSSNLMTFLERIRIVDGSRRLSNIEDRIVGGTLAARNQFPFQVMLEVEEKDGNFSYCGGSIISASYVLTAAHCFEDFKKALLMAGILNFVTVHILSIYPADVTNHPKYNMLTMENDISIVSTRKSPFRFNTRAVKPIVMAPRSFANKDLTGMSNRIAGWGITKDNGSESEWLLYIDTPAISQAECKKYFKIYDSNYCISGANKKSTCDGDSGGGATVVNGNSRILLGVLSYGDESCQKGLPDVMTRITSYHDWISQVTGITII